MFWTITYAAKYASAIALVNGPAMLRSALQVVVGPNLVFWLLPWAGALVMWWESRLDGLSPKSRVQSPKSKAQGPGADADTDETANPQSPIADRRSPIPHGRFFLTVLLFCSFASASVGLYFREHYFITVLPVLALLTGVAVSRALAPAET